MNHLADGQSVCSQLCSKECRQHRHVFEQPIRSCFKTELLLNDLSYTS